MPNWHEFSKTLSDKKYEFQHDKWFQRLPKGKSYEDIC